MMQAQSHAITIVAFPLQELNELEAVINASKQMLATLEQRRTQVLIELDRLTKPSIVPPAPNAWITPRVEFKGETRLKWSYIDLYVCALEFLWNECPDKRKEMAAAMASCGYTRRYVAQYRDELFSGQSASWVMQHSRELVAGWYVDTNINLERMRRVLMAAVRASGLQMGQDIKVYWKSTKVPL
jgi:hypothetical protein